jgi:hypothetical protein
MKLSWIPLLAFLETGVALGLLSLLPVEARPSTTVLAGCLGWISIASGLGIGLWRGREGPGGLELRHLDRDGVSRPAFVLPASRSKLRARALDYLLVLLVGACLLVLPGAPGVEEVHPDLVPIYQTMLTLFHVSGALTIWVALRSLHALYSGIGSGRRDLALIPAGVLCSSSNRSWLIPWEAIEGISSPKGGAVRALGIRVLMIRIRDLSRVVPLPSTRLLPLHRPGALPIRANYFTVRPEEVERVLAYYLAHPEERDQIGTAEGLEQITRPTRGAAAR